ncbi:hypothetical protein SUGI_1158390 [Cryptomeria japonica]|nr:hypothetical protein SUGI_1158390 [Cryptomeria japonica]
MWNSRPRRKAEQSGRNVIRTMKMEHGGISVGADSGMTKDLTLGSKMVIIELLILTRNGIKASFETPKLIMVGNREDQGSVRMGCSGKTEERWQTLGKLAIGKQLEWSGKENK